MTATISFRGRLLALGASLATVGCNAAGGYFGEDTEGSSASDTNGVPGTSTDSPTTGLPPPEEEDEGDFRVPQASGKYVYSASEEIDAVAVIDTATLAIDVVGVGRDPTIVAPIPGVPDGEGAVAVLDRGSSDVVVLRTTADMRTSVELFAVTPGANNLAVTPDGGFVFVYHDVDGPEQLGPGSDQELSVLDLAGGAVYEMTVGAHPREIVFAGDGTAAYVITAAGVNVIDLGGLGAIGKPPLIPVVPDPAVDPATVEVHVVAAQGVALSRVDGQEWVAVTDLSDGTLSQIDLGGVLTDLDLAGDDSFAVAVLPDLAGSRFAEIALPPGGPPEVVFHDVGGEYVGLANLSDDGAAMVLYTTQDPWAGAPVGPRPFADAQDPAFASTGEGSSGSTGEGDSTGGVEPPPPQFDPRSRLTLARRDGGGWQLDTLFVEVPVETVGLAPDSANAIIVHRDTNDVETPGSYSLLDITQPFPLAKRQTTAAAPGAVLFTPDGGRAAISLRDDDRGVAQVDLIDLPTFIVQTLDLGSPPEGLGWVAPTAKIFVSQAHATGRITFIDPAGMVQTITGFVLNDSVKD
jgi:YVTN family beta-propeller protein